MGFSFYDRNGSTGFKWNSQDNFKTCEKVRGVDNVIDIAMINHWGDCYSVDPKVYLNNMNIPDSYTGNTASDYTARCNDDFKEPIYGPETNRSKFLESMYIRGGYQSNGSDRVSVDKLRATYGWKSMLQSDTGINHWQDKCTEFSLLYHSTSSVDYLALKGYKFFVPDNFNHWKNWIMYPTSGGNYYVYVMVMYLTAEHYAKHLGCFDGKRNDHETMLIRLFSDSQNLTNKSLMIAMGNEFCSNQIPSYSYLTQGEYNMGTVIYSPNTRFILIIQGDGNMVIYEQGTGNSDGPSSLTARWESNTSSYPRATLSIQSDGNIVLYSKKTTGARVLSIDRAVWSTDTAGRGNQVKLGLTNTGTLIVFKGHPKDNNLDVIKGYNGTNSEGDTEIRESKNFFNSKCGTYSDNTVANIEAKYNYCVQGRRIIDDADCGNLFNQNTIEGDTQNNFKKKMDTHVKSLCVNADTSTDDSLKQFCMCITPSGTVKEVFEQTSPPYPPKCWDKTCQTYGYRIMEDEKCPINLCIQSINILNSIVASGATVQNSCTITNSNGTGGTTNQRPVNQTTTKLCGRVNFSGNKQLGTDIASNLKIVDKISIGNINSKYYNFIYYPSDYTLRPVSNRDKCLTASSLNSGATFYFSNYNNMDTQKFLYDTVSQQLLSSRDNSKAITILNDSLQLTNSSTSDSKQRIIINSCEEREITALTNEVSWNIEQNRRCGKIKKDSLCVMGDCNKAETDFIFDPLDNSIRNLHQQEKCLTKNLYDTLYMETCSDYAQAMGEQTLGSIFTANTELSDEQQFWYNTATKQILMPKLGNKDRCIEWNNGTLEVRQCSGSMNQQFSLSKDTCSNATITELANAEINRIKEEERIANEKNASVLREEEIRRQQTIGTISEASKIAREQALRAALEAANNANLASKSDTTAQTTEEDYTLVIIAILVLIVVVLYSYFITKMKKSNNIDIIKKKE